MITRRINIFSSLFFLLLTLFSAPSMLLASDAGTDKSELVILNWSEYIDPELIKKFEKQHNISIRGIYYESDDYRDNYMLEIEAKGIDIILVNGIALRRYRQQEWLAPVTEKDVPNMKYIEKKWLTMFEGAEGYVVPYFWGTLGIAYRKDLVNGEIKSWKDLFQPDEAVHGKITMVPASRDLIGMALKALGYSANSTSASELEEAKKLLLQQKPYVKDYAHITLDETSSMIKGDILMAMTYSGDALLLADIDENIAYIVPEEGGNFWVDYMTVSKSSRNKELAYKFLDFLNEPAHAAQLAEYVFYATPNMEAEKLLPDEHMSNKLIYPPKDVLEKSEAYTRLPPRVTRIRNEIFSFVTK